MTREQLDSLVAMIPPEVIAFGILAFLGWAFVVADPVREQDRPESPLYRG